jgi:hypothetical protein
MGYRRAFEALGSRGGLEVLYVARHIYDHLPDGQRAVAEIEAESPEASYQVQYAGAFSRLIESPKESDVAFLSFVMRDSADKTGGTLSEHLTGQYDRWAGGPNGL